MKKNAAFLAIGIVLAIAAFFIGVQVGDSGSSDSTAADNVEVADTMKKDSKMDGDSEMKSEKMHGADGHTHEMLELDDALPTPAATIVVEEDAMKGYNLNVELENFEFKPENVNQAEGPTPQNEGHAHIYVNGEKLTRLYGTGFFLGESVKEGDKVKIVLSTNKHREILSSNEVTV